MAGFGDWLKGVGEKVTTNLGDVLSNAASNLFSGQAAKTKAEAEKAAAEAEAYKTILQAQSTAAAAGAGTTIITSKTGNMLDLIKKYWYVPVIIVVGYFLLGALKKKSRVTRRRRRKSPASSSSSSRKRSTGTRKRSGVRRGKGRRIGNTWYPNTSEGRAAWSRAMRRRRKQKK